MDKIQKRLNESKINESVHDKELRIDILKRVAKKMIGPVDANQLPALLAAAEYAAFIDDVIADRGVKVAIDVMTTGCIYDPILFVNFNEGIDYELNYGFYKGIGYTLENVWRADADDSYKVRKAYQAHIIKSIQTYG